MTIYQAAMAWLILNEGVALVFLRRAKMSGQPVKGGHRRLSATRADTQRGSIHLPSETVFHLEDVSHPLFGVQPVLIGAVASLAGLVIVSLVFLLLG
jgi:hypothetical protein